LRIFNASIIVCPTLAYTTGEVPIPVPIDCSSPSRLYFWIISITADWEIMLTRLFSLSMTQRRWTLFSARRKTASLRVDSIEIGKKPPREAMLAISLTFMFPKTSGFLKIDLHKSRFRNSERSYFSVSKSAMSIRSIIPIYSDVSLL
jgi:hypothetical protein